MTSRLFTIIIILIAFSFHGCLTFHRISYELTVKDGFAGEGIITIYDIRSDAETDEEFEEDKNDLFNYMLKSDTFLKDMMAEGKDINSRELFVSDDLLNAKVKFSFDKIQNVEGIAFQDGFYYLTMEPDDSIHSTNGEIVVAENYKRIIWGKKIETIKFEMIATDYDDMYYRNLAPFYKE